jgi:ABC-type transporter Mla subunit MlaD
VTEHESPEQPGGTAAMLQGLITMLGEVLDRLDQRLAATEASLGRLRPEELDQFLERLDRRVESVGMIEASVARLEEQAVVERLEELSGAVDAMVQGLSDLAARVARLEEASRATVDELGPPVQATLDQAVETSRALESLRSLLEAHVEDTANSLGQRASKAGRRLASELGLRPRPRPPDGEHGH